MSVPPELKNWVMRSGLKIQKEMYARSCLRYTCTVHFPLLIKIFQLAANEGLPTWVLVRYTADTQCPGDASDPSCSKDVQCQTAIPPPPRWYVDPQTQKRNICNAQTPWNGLWLPATHWCCASIPHCQILQHLYHNNNLHLFWRLERNVHEPVCKQIQIN